MAEEKKETRDHEAHRRLDQLETKAAQLELKLEENTEWTKKIAVHTEALPELVAVVSEMKAVMKFSSRISGFILKLATLVASVFGLVTFFKDHFK
jgi:hypothetical protein